MPTEILPAASLRSTARLPVARALVWASNHLIRMVLWSIGRAISGSNRIFTLFSGRGRLPDCRRQGATARRAVRARYRRGGVKRCLASAHLGAALFPRGPAAAQPPPQADRTAPVRRRARGQPGPALPVRERRLFAPRPPERSAARPGSPRPEH